MWCRKHDACVSCGLNSIKHQSNGLCARCYGIEYRNRPDVKAKKARNAKERAIRLKEHIRAKAKINRDIREFGANRETAMARDGYKCTKCNSVENLVVHHIDGNGIASEIPNHSLDNLTTLCKPCHIDIHRDQLHEAREATGWYRPKIGRYKKNA